MLDSNLFNKLPIELLMHIYQYLDPAATGALAQSEKKQSAQLEVVQAKWKAKCQLHFPHHFFHPRTTNWYAAFCKAYEADYAGLTSRQRALFSLVKENDLDGLKALQPPVTWDELSSDYLKDAGGRTLADFFGPHHQPMADYFYACFLKAADESDKCAQLYWAVQCNQLQVLFELVEKFDANDFRDYVLMGGLLHEAVARGQAEVVTFFLDNLPNHPDRLNAIDYWGGNKFRSPLYYAVVHGQAHMVHLLLERGADNLADTHITRYNKSPLCIAVEKGNLELVRLFFERDPKPDLNLKAQHRRFTLLHSAAYQGHVEMVRYLLEQGATINPVDKDGNTPLMWARTWQHVPLISLLEAQYAQDQIPESPAEVAQKAKLVAMVITATVKIPSFLIDLQNYCLSHAWSVRGGIETTYTDDHGQEQVCLLPDGVYQITQLIAQEHKHPTQNPQALLRLIAGIAEEKHSDCFQLAHAFFRGRDSETNAFYRQLAALQDVRLKDLDLPMEAFKNSLVGPPKNLDLQV